MYRSIYELCIQACEKGHYTVCMGNTLKCLTMENMFEHDKRNLFINQISIDLAWSQS